MSAQTLVARVEALERQMSELRALAARVEDLGTQFSQFQLEVRSAFSAVRAEVRTGDEETRRLMRVLREDLVGRIALFQEGLRPSTSRTRGRANAKQSKKGSG